MNFEAKLFSSDNFIGIIKAKSLRSLKQKASALCNNYYNSLDTMILYNVNNTSVNLKFTRINKLSANNDIHRGQWR